ncbi:hypothetical protein ABG067_006483 [Albugo candida]
MAPDWLFISPELLDDSTLQKIISKVAKRESKLIRHRQAQERYRGRLRNSKIQELKLVVCLLSKIQKNCKEILVLRKGNREYRKKLSLIRRLILDYSGALESILYEPQLHSVASNKLSLIRRLILDYSGALESILYEPQLHSVASNKVGELECGAMDTPEILAKVLLREVMERLSPLGRIEDMAEMCFKSVLDNAAFAASQYDPNTAKVLGWTDQRQVSETEARFMFTKHFPNGDLNGFADRTFDTSLVYEKYRLYSFEKVMERLSPLGRIEDMAEICFKSVLDNAAFAASQYDPNTAKVLGWTDQRQVSETEARFMFTKHFPNGDLNGFADRTFDTSLVYEKYRLVQNWVTDMSILQKINENTYLMLRENAAPNTDFQFRTIYLLFRFFADDGNTIVVATKSLEDCIQDSMPNSRMPYIKALYSFYDPNTAKVLGWTDQRQVSETEARFMFTKHFPNGDLNGFADRTFDTSLVYEKYRLVQNWVTDMSILQKINENTYLMLRENAAPNTDFQFRTIYLLFRFFADDGNTIVVATKSLEDCIQDSMPNSRMPYIKALYSFVFTKYTPHLSGQNQANAIDVPIASKKGCFVQLGGQVGVGSKSGAKRLISEAIQCALRWENMCVEPLFQFK